MTNPTTQKSRRRQRLSTRRGPWRTDAAFASALFGGGNGGALLLSPSTVRIGN
jgi:hypothetical protein